MLIKKPTCSKIQGGPVLQKKKIKMTFSIRRAHDTHPHNALSQEMSRNLSYTKSTHQKKGTTIVLVLIIIVPPKKSIGIVGNFLLGGTTRVYSTYSLEIKRFLLDERLQRKFAIFLEYDNPGRFFRFSFCLCSFFPLTFHQAKTSFISEECHSSVLFLEYILDMHLVFT